MSSEFVPSRLEFARRRRGLPRTKVAAAIEVASKTLQRWENGDGQPGKEAIEGLSSFLRVLPEFFFAPELEVLPEQAVSFRALSKMTSAERGGATAAGRIGVEFMRWIEGQFQLPDADVPSLTGWEPELAADSLRVRWELGTGPIRKILPLVEKHGVRVLSVAPDYKSVDAFSFYDAGTPFMFLDTTKTAERLRFDAAHELGHLVLHGEHENPFGKEAELQANCFASAFLMPADSVYAVGLQAATPDQIIQAKGKWQVAAMALAHRLNFLGLLTEWQYRSACVDLSQRGFRRAEPGSKLRAESSQILRKVMEQLRSEDMTVKRIGAIFGLPPDEMSGYLFGLAVTAQEGGGERVGSVGGERHLKAVPPLD